MSNRIQEALKALKEAHFWVRECCLYEELDSETRMELERHIRDAHGILSQCNDGVELERVELTDSESWI